MRAMTSRFAMLALTVFAGCFPTRSQNLTCSEDNDCDGIAGAPRVCDNGYCVTRTSNVVDAPPGTELDAPPSEACAIEWPGTTSLFAPCDIPDHNDVDIVLSQPGTYTLDTANGTITVPVGAAAVTVISARIGALDARLISVKSFTVAPNVILRVIGPDPLIVAAWSTITINGTIDGSSGITAGADVTGAGASAITHCVAATAGTANNNGDGGGGGGGYQGAGGTGGAGGDGDDGTAGTAGGAHAAPMIAAGCPGSLGSTSAGAGLGGNGGGAVWLTAKDSISVVANGVVTVGGAGGKGATDNRAGGGGGGSGGLIGLEAPVVTNAGTLAANGGAGGQGEDNGNEGINGAPGGATATAPAVGGGQPNQNGSSGGRGGNGSVGTAQVGTVGNQGGNGNGDSGGGGGGGGGGGYIIFVGASPSGTASPVAIAR